MGVGFPEEIVYAVSCGIDMFDCVIPTRYGRHGYAFVFEHRDLNLWQISLSSSAGLVRPITQIGLTRSSPTPRTLLKGSNRSKSFYKILNLKNEPNRADASPIDPHCSCFACQNYSKAYIRHLFKIGDMLGARLAAIHNMRFYLELMRRIREGVLEIMPP